jgi:blue copper oxidase
MKIRFIAALLLLASIGNNVVAQFNTMWIPDTLSGTTFNLIERDTFTSILFGEQTITGGINGSIWGPTLIWNKWDTVHMNVTNNLIDTTTLHWHGMHLPAIMDGGPHQLIPPGTTWRPYWQVTNNAATYWYHPHLCDSAESQLTTGLGGLIIVRDSAERALALPRTYSVDDIPLVLTDRKFDGSNQFVEAPYGDTMMANFTVRAQYTIPAQVVRFRLLDAAIERSYNIGFSDNRTFYVIGTDGGLLDTSVGLTRLQINPGERYEILINCNGQAGDTVDMMAYNASFPNSVGGGDSLPGSPFANALAKINFRILHLNIGAATSGAITSVPHELTSNSFYSISSAVLTRNLTITDSTGVAGTTGPNAFVLDHRLFNFDTINFTVPLNNTEIWQISSSSFFGHPFHVHDVEFYVLSVDGAAAPDYMQGWKDVVFVPANETVKFITRFSDYSDSVHPYMFHCHIALHEDEGMMNQFVVGGSSTGLAKTEKQITDFTLYPDPATDKLYVLFADPTMHAYYARIFDLSGRTMFMLPNPQLAQGIDISALEPGDYFLQVTDDKTKTTITKKFIKGSHAQ